MDPDRPVTASSSDRGAVVLAPKKNRWQRFSRVANAAATIEGFDQDTDITFALTLGQFSLLDLIEATLDITGPADVVIATWSVGFYDLAAAERFRDLGKLRSCRFVMDSSAKRGQATGADVASVFGADAIRTTRTHAKFALIENDAWHVVIQSSMNLNLNERSEQFSMTDCAQTAQFVRTIVDELWCELPAGPTSDRTTPKLPGMAAVEPRFGFEVAPASVVTMGVNRGAD